MLQSGLVKKVIDIAAEKTSNLASSLGADSVSNSIKEGSTSLNDSLSKAKGRTGITKLNSTQVFSSMPPVKISMKLLFRARGNAHKEVSQPLKKLIQWAVPQALSSDGMLVNAISDSDGGGSFLDVLLPSTTPLLIAMEYKGRTYKPMVIESITDPITSPTTQSGDYARAEIDMVISTLSALDRKDIGSLYQ